MLHNCWVRFLELILYLENKPLGGKVAHADLLEKDYICKQDRVGERSLETPRKHLMFLYACSKLMF